MDLKRTLINTKSLTDGRDPDGNDASVHHQADAGERLLPDAAGQHGGLALNL